MIKVTPLFSGSKGNCTLVQTPHANVLLDAGFGYRAVAARLNKAGVAVEEISAIVITHEHSDHISALPQLAKYSGATVFAPTQCVNYIAETCLCSNVQGVAGSWQIGDAQVDVFRCSHDSRACFGYRFVTQDDCVASVTDTGVVSEELVQFLRPCRAVILESNHDSEMLLQGDYPYYLKRRIASDFGHLSNAQCAQIVSKLANSCTKSLCLAHLSQQNNRAELALASATAALESAGLKAGQDVFVCVADQYENEVVL